MSFAALRGEAFGSALFTALLPEAVEVDALRSASANCATCPATLAKVKKWVDERHESTALAVWDYKHDPTMATWGRGVADQGADLRQQVADGLLGLAAGGLLARRRRTAR